MKLRGRKGKREEEEERKERKEQGVTWSVLGGGVWNTR